MSPPQKRLGRGLSSLISPNIESPPDGRLAIESGPEERLPASAPVQRSLTIPLERVRANPAQPRRSFDDDRLLALADSIRRNGTLQPIIVRPAEGGYELVAGERRLRACKLAAVTEIPAIVRPTSDEQLLELALIENIHRENLNVVERARAYKTLHIHHSLSHDEIGQRLGDDRSTVSNYIRILDLCEDVLKLLAADTLSIGHAKALLGIRDPRLQAEVGSRAARERWSVRQMEAYIRRMKPKPTDGSATPKVRPPVRDVMDRLSAAVGSRVTIREGRRRHSGKITIEYSSLEEFERIAGLLGVQSESLE